MVAMTVVVDDAGAGTMTVVVGGDGGTGTMTVVVVIGRPPLGVIGVHVAQGSDTTGVDDRTPTGIGETTTGPGTQPPEQTCELGTGAQFVHGPDTTMVVGGSGAPGGDVWSCQ